MEETWLSVPAVERDFRYPPLFLMSPRLVIIGNNGTGPRCRVRLPWPATQAENQLRAQLGLETPDHTANQDNAFRQGGHDQSYGWVMPHHSSQLIIVGIGYGKVHWCVVGRGLLFRPIAGEAPISVSGYIWNGLIFKRPSGLVIVRLWTRPPDTA